MSAASGSPTPLGPRSGIHSSHELICLTVPFVHDEDCSGEAAKRKKKKSTSLMSPGLLFLVTDGYLSKHHPNHPTVVSAGFAIHHTWTLMIVECMHRPAYRSLLILGLILEVDRKVITVHMGDSVASEGALAPLWEIEMTI